MDYDVLVLGGGIIGCAAAYELSKYNLNIAVIEKEYDIADDISFVNTAIVYDGSETSNNVMSGLEYIGNILLEDLCSRFNVPFKRIGALRVVNDENGVLKLKEMYDRTVKRGIDGICLINGDEVKKIEPNINTDIKKGLYSKNVAIVAPYDLAIAYAEVASENGVNFRLEEEVLNIIEKENPEGVILQFGGQTAIKLANFLNEKNIPILGTGFENIDAAEDREKFDELLEKLDINRPRGIAVWSAEEGISHAKEIGYPVLVRPSYVLGGQGMEITYEEHKLEAYLKNAFERDSKNPVLIDKYLVGREIEVDAICDGEDVLIPGIMEHLERAGVHSGDSITMYPTQNVSDEIKEKILDYTKKIALELNVLGMVNIQFIEFKGELYIIEVNPRASRTVPYISKVSGVPIVDLATKCMLGAKLKDLGYGNGIYKTPELISVKVPVFSMSKLARVDISLGPEMKSTGEVLGVGQTLEEALYKGFMASGRSISDDRGMVLATVNDHDKEEFLEIAKDMKNLGYTFLATEGTAKILRKNDIDAITVNKIGEGKPNILDAIMNNQVDMVINTPTKGNDATRDGFKIRRTATEYNVDVMTSLDTLKALVKVNKKYINSNDIKVYNIAE